MDLIQLLSFILGFIGIFLLFLTYMYIDKLEKIGCACAAHPYQGFIKVYPLFAIIYILATMFITPQTLAKQLGPGAAAAMMFVEGIFIVATLIFFVLALVYVSYLKKAKCACSEDIRREVLYWYAIIEIIILGSLVVLGILKFLVFGAAGLALSGVEKLAGSEGVVREATLNPIKTIQRVPASLKKTLKDVRKMRK